MKAALFHDHGGPEVVRLEQVERPAPAFDEVLVRVGASALNHLDLWLRRGLPVETTMPHIGGSDVAGTVEEVGSGVEGVEPGARVVVNPSLACGRCEWCRAGEEPLCVEYRILGEHTQGGLAEYVVAPARNLHPIPEGYPMERAAAAPLVFATAWRALMGRGGLRAGESVLITGGSGGVSTAAIQIAKLAGARVFAVTSSAHVEQVRRLGADVVLDRTEQDYAREVWQATGRRGVDLVLDSVGAETWEANVRCLARTGRIVVYGATTGPKGSLDLRQVFWKQLQVIGTTMSNAAEFDRVMSLVFSGRLEPVVDVVWPLERVVEAHERLEAGDAFGKIVLTP